MTDRHPSRPCGVFLPVTGDPHTATYCNLQQGHVGPHHSILKGTSWEDVA